jgi:EAL domain-containing protein (putative c-di-GMP-specific phosphodiesterase class I)
LARCREATFAALVTPRDSSDSTLESLAASIVSALEQPIEFDGGTVEARVTVGVVRIPADSTNPRSFLRHAELAAREAQRHCTAPVRLLSRDSIVQSERRRETIKALRVAVSKEQLNLHYQPIIDIELKQVYSLEALARWEHSQLGCISPSVFIPLAEEAGLMVPLGDWVMRRACADARNLFKAKFHRISVNASVSQILDSRFMYYLYTAIETAGIEPAIVELELTETVFAEDIDRVCKLLTDVRQLGVSVAIDDFGAGYSSLAYLSRLPVDVLKIDRTFVQDFDRGGEAIISAALSVARTRNIKVIVEGIETAVDLEKVRALGITTMQGFFFARPMPAESLIDWHEQFAGQLGAA